MPENFIPKEKERDRKNDRECVRPYVAVVYVHMCMCKSNMVLNDKIPLMLWELDIFYCGMA